MTKAGADNQIEQDDTRGLKLGMLLISGFVVPFLLVFLTSHDSDAGSRFLHALRLGGFGFFLALFILGLGYVDQKLRKSAPRDKKAELAATLLGTMLWLVWLGTGQIVFIAADETGPADMTSH